MIFCRWFLCLLASACAVSCASRPPAYQEQGWASYVADQYTGRLTSSGVLYHPQGYTAAHTSLPFGTVVTVKNVLNGRSVNVTVNDRFPYYPGRVINLSSAAAQHIGIPYMQMGQVRVTATSMPGSAYGRQQPATPTYAGYRRAPTPAASKTYASYPARQTPRRSPTPQAPRNYGYQQQPAAGNAPNAPGYSGGTGTPPGLKTF